MLIKKRKFYTVIPGLLQSLHYRNLQIEYNRFKTWHPECSVYFQTLQLSSVNLREKTMTFTTTITENKLNNETKSKLRAELIRIGYEYPNLYVESVLKINVDITVQGKFGVITFKLDRSDMV